MILLQDTDLTIRSRKERVSLINLNLTQLFAGWIKTIQYLDYAENIGYFIYSTITRLLWLNKFLSMKMRSIYPTDLNE